MNANDSIDTVTRGLTICADRLGDIVPTVYERFFALSDEGRQLMGHSDQYMRGRMFEEVLELFMSDEPFGPNGYLDWELRNHLDAYNAKPSMYEALFEAITQIVRESVGSGWTDRDTSAWQDRVDRIMDQVNSQSEN